MMAESKREGIGSGVSGVVSATLIALTLSACGGGGGSSPMPTPSVSTQPSVAPSTAPQSIPVGGTVSQIPSDAYGPATILGTTYASTDASTATPLPNATVILGPVPVTGPTPPATLPAGDVAVTTNASGQFSATLTVAPAAPTSAEPFILPLLNLTNFVPPATGYYVEVFGPGTDGKSAGVPFPLHRFVAASTTMSLRVSTATAAEAAALLAVNQDRANNGGAGPLTFDESAEETARLHASDMAQLGYFCHYDLHNAGPISRYLQVGGIGETGENIGGAGAVLDTTGAFAQVEADFLAEKPQNGGHYRSLIELQNVWAGLAAVPSPITSGAYAVDYELVIANGVDPEFSAYGYTNESCPSNIVVNNS